MLLGAALAIALESVRHLETPHHAPVPFTLVLLVGVIPHKEVRFRRVLAGGAEVESQAVRADPWHHRSDAITSTAPFIGIGTAVWKGPGWESADDWAALVASIVIAVIVASIVRPAVHELMDRAPDPSLLERIARAASGVHDVRAIETLEARRARAHEALRAVLTRRILPPRPHRLRRLDGPSAGVELGSDSINRV